MSEFLVLFFVVPLGVGLVYGFVCSVIARKGRAA